MILLLLYGNQENQQVTCQNIEGISESTASRSTENVDMNPSNEELYMIDDPEIMKVLLPKLEGKYFSKP